MRQLSGQDATFIFMEKRATPLHLTSLYIYDPSTAPGKKVTYKQLMAHIESRLGSSKVFTQKLLHVPMDLDYPYWVDDPDFDLEFHVRHIALPAPRDWRQLCILTSRLHSQGLDMSRPPWEMYIIEGLDNIEGIPPGSFATLSKYHHAAIDGASGVEIVSGLHDLSPKPVRHKQQASQADEPPSTVELLKRSGINNVRLPFHLASVLARTRPGFDWLPRRKEPEEERAEAPKRPVPRTPFNQPVSAHRVFTGQMLELADFKTIRQAVTGVTINDVVLATCAGALRRYLLAVDELPEEPLVAGVPINTRTEKDRDLTGNVVSSMSIPLQTHVDDPVQRLEQIRDLTAAEKTTEKAVSARRMTDINHHLPATTLTMASRLISATGLMHRSKPLFNCVITNVPGPQVPLYQCGAELLATWGCGPLLDGVGLIISAHSYNGKMFLCATSCRDIMPDPGLFAECMQASFDELLAALRPRRKGSKARKRR
ncbi:wax ester/triacylglycerol synthase family O-acyltransferase [Seongchinamella sediminis]|uniref:diacylglycerol O-acyltransferase n=1 Tax=Seongchinamella sediminis TaxID=2283635 RepID=A0A3L7E0S2_9GAMM|nr:wax ester/triacylglycerol synthase family O-acyltransferase [Seongchinamella sediminis]RLQ22529.1 wax ester/triacylglycerol synthase family O-acyltransferase [Seongchinamella sediminis]